MWNLLDFNTVTGAKSIGNSTVIHHDDHRGGCHLPMLACSRNSIHSRHGQFVRLTHAESGCRFIARPGCRRSIDFGSQTESHLDRVQRCWNGTSLCRPTQPYHHGHGSQHLGVVRRSLDRVVAAFAQGHQILGRVSSALGQRNDVIDDGRRLNAPSRQAQSAQRFAFARLLAQSLPSTSAPAVYAVMLPRHQSTRKSSDAILTLTNEAAPMTLAQCMQTTCASSCHAPASVRASITAFARLSMSGFLVRH